MFKEQEGSFLVGVIAADTSKTGKVGSSAAWTSRSSRGSNADTLKASNTLRVKAKSSPTGRERAGGVERSGQGRRTRQVADGRGADIVYAAAGATGQGVLKAAADAGNRHGRRFQPERCSPAMC